MRRIYIFISTFSRQTDDQHGPPIRDKRGYIYIL